MLYYIFMLIKAKCVMINKSNIFGKIMNSMFHCRVNLKQPQYLNSSRIVI